ncbi:MAG TPA: GntR family transcriptional regulator [Pseudolabrys sp.]|nr:GntR family transcriptional regulator [Pseudolabrys sp.]
MTIADRIQRSLIERIVSGQLPPGSKLEEKTLADEFGVSRTPIREALRELSSRGLVEFIPRRGGVVAQRGTDQLADMLDAECEMEALCARLAALRMTAVEKSVLQTFHQDAKHLVTARDEVAYLGNNQIFHNMICDGAHNSTLTQIAMDLRMRLAPFRQSQRAAAAERLSQSYDEHTKVVEAVINGDPDAAYMAMRWHNARISSAILGLLNSAVQKKSAVDHVDDGPAGGQENQSAERDRSALRAGRKGLRKPSTV